MCLLFHAHKMAVKLHAFRIMWILGAVAKIVCRFAEFLSFSADWILSRCQFKCSVQTVQNLSKLHNTKLDGVHLQQCIYMIFFYT